MAVTTNREPGPFPRDERKRDQWFTQLRAHIQSIVDNATDDTALGVHVALTSAHGASGNIVGQTTLDAHTNATSAHGASGAIVGQTTLDAHTTATTGAHGVSGTPVGTGNTATTGTAGVVLKTAAVTSVATADAPTQTAGYVQADVQDIADLANDNKTQINALLAALRTAGIVTT